MTHDPQKIQNLATLAWPFQEAERILTRLNGKVPAKGYVLFETGYGPSGLPHIGTFMEVYRTTLVQHAFEMMSDIPTKLFCVSDDMDGLRKIPDNIPQPEMLREHLHKPLTATPDPFGTHESYGKHMNSKLCGFLDAYGFEYEFHSSTENYKSGMYDEKLLEILKHYDKVMDVMLPTLGEERRATYSPFMPLCPKTGHVLQVPITSVDTAAGTVSYVDASGETMTVPVTGGACKLQWKPDFGMRWAALDVDFEMYGKDHQPSAPLYDAICKIAGGKPPAQYVYELFLDEEGKKISKSKGNGVTIEQWLAYAPKESLSYYMFLSPRKAKRLHFDVIPKAVDEYQTFLGKFSDASEDDQLKNPVWHIHGGKPPKAEEGPSYNLLLNLASVCNTEDEAVLWGFISKYLPNATPASHPFLDSLAKTAVRYYHDFIKPNKKYRAPTELEAKALAALAEHLKNTPEGASAADLQQAVYDVGKQFYDPKEIKAWFSAMYETLLGADQGPRMGSFIELYGVSNTVKLIQHALENDLAA